MSKHAFRARTGQDRANLYDEITDKIIAELEAGRVPWVQPWRTAAAKAPLAMPKNASTERFYAGINVLILRVKTRHRPGFQRSRQPSPRRGDATLAAFTAMMFVTAMMENAMTQYSTSDLSRKSGDIIAEALRRPVTITQRNKPRLVLLSIEDYRRLMTKADTRKAGRLETTPDDLFEGVKEAVSAYEQEGDET